MTVKDIARLASVSTATVSRVLNNQAAGNMRVATKKRVERVIKQTGYTSHALAVGLRKGSLKVIGVILPTNTNPYYAQLSGAIENESIKNGYLTLICNSNSSLKKEKDYIRLLKSQRVSGILLCSTGLSGGEITDMQDANTKIVLLDEEVTDYRGDTVIVDDDAGGYMGAKYLLGLGHRHILIINGPKNLNSCRNRLSGFKRYAGEHGVHVERPQILPGDFTSESAFQAVRQAIKQGTGFTAIFALNDLMAIGAVDALNQSGVRVPADVSVLGFDNIFIDEHFQPRITTVASPIDKVGSLAVLRVINRAGGAMDEDQRLVLKPRILVRESCSAVRNAVR